MRRIGLVGILLWARASACGGASGGPSSTGFEDEKRRAAFKKLAAARFDSALLEDATVAPLKLRAR